jgi:RND family efflux transporter MFP subunit
MLSVMAEDELQRLEKANQSLTRELLAAYEELDLLHTLAAIFSTSSDVDEMGRRLVDEAVDSLAAGAGFLVFTGEGMEEFDPVLRGADADEVQAYVRVAAPRVLQGEPVLLDQALAEGYEPRPLLMVPLRSRDGIFGALGLLRLPGARAFTAGENQALSVLAAQAAGVILQKRNLDLTYLSERLQKTNEGLQALLEISRELTATLDVGRVLAAIVNLPGRVVPYERASISLKEGARWRLRAVSGSASVDRAQPGVKDLEALHGWLAERGEAVQLEVAPDGDEAAVEGPLPGAFQDALRRAGMASLQALPLKDEEGTLGILALERSQSGALPVGTQEVLTVLANQATVALRNAQLYSQVPLIGVLEPILAQRRRFGQMSWSRRLGWIGAVAALVAILVLVPVPVQVKGACLLVPAETFSVSSTVAGRVEQVEVAEGAAVLQGQVVARLADRELRLAMGEARARTEAAERRVRQLEASMAPGAASLERVRLERHRREQELAAAALRATILEAPRDGVILTPRVGEQVGRRLEVGETFCTLAVLDPLEAEVAVPESDAALVVEGRAVRMKLDAYPGRTFGGEVIAVRPAAEERGGKRVLVARVGIPNPDGDLRPGMQGRGRIQIERRSLGYSLVRRPARWFRSWFWF